MSTIAGWGNYPKHKTILCRPESISALSSYHAFNPNKTFLPRGFGRSYGDAAVNTAGATVLMERLNRMLAFDEQSGLLKCESGVTIKDIVQVFLHRGWFPLVVPGTQQVTIGGAIASDIHGKNHHRDGSFSKAVKNFTLLLANGETVNCSREENTELFWATVGGMGLTGFILDVELFLQKVPSSYIVCKTLKAQDLDQALQLFEQFEPHYQYSVAWLDCLAPARSCGRSILFFGNHAAIDDLPNKIQAKPFANFDNGQLTVPFDMPTGFLNKTSIGTFNEIYWLTHKESENNEIVDCSKFFFPLDRLNDWNRFYGRNGFIQYQCVVNFDRGPQVLSKILALAAQYEMGSFLTVLKRFGPETGILSFPKAGYTLTLDIPVKSNLMPFLNLLNDEVITAEGRVYLAKDACLSPDYFRAMYPNYKKWQQIKSQFDPNNIFRSALSERIGLTPS